MPMMEEHINNISFQLEMQKYVVSKLIDNLALL